MLDNLDTCFRFDTKRINACFHSTRKKNNSSRDQHPKNNTKSPKSPLLFAEYSPSDFIAPVNLVDKGKRTLREGATDVPKSAIPAFPSNISKKYPADGKP